MRYILDNYGYVEEVIFGGYIQCNNKSCTEYIGEIPSGYSSLEDWNENANIRAYKIVDGNLVYDATKDAELQALYSLEEELNRTVTRGELNNTLSNFNAEISNKGELASILPVRSEDGEVITLFDSSSCPMERIEIECNETIEDSLTLYISTINMLPNEVLSGNKNGIRYTVNEDKSIDLQGSVTDSFELTVSGSEANTEPLFILKADEKYYIEDLPSNVTLNLYTNDGTERTLVYTGTGDSSITLDVDTPITHAEITCTGTINETIELMLSAGGTSKEYEPCFYNKVLVDLNSKTAKKGSLIEIEDMLVMLDGDATNVMDLPSTYYEKTTIYADKDVYLNIDYKKSSFEYVTSIGKGTLTLKNTADGYGSIRLFRIEGLTGGRIYTLETSDGNEQVETYDIDLTTYAGLVDVAIEEGKTYVYLNDENIGMLDNVQIKTYSPTTYISVLEGSYNLLGEYMLASDFSVYCTRVEKDASIKLLQDQISLEVSRASAVEGELAGRITVEADRIEQIVTSVGADGEVTAASIVTAINEGESLVLIKGDKIDLEGKTFPTIQNEAGDCKITTLFENIWGDGIEYNTEAMHVFNGSVLVNPSLNLYGFQVKDTNGEEVFRTADTFVNIGKTNAEVRLYGKVLVNGKEIGSGGGTVDLSNYYTRDEIDSMIGDVEAVLNTLNSGGGV